LGNRRERELNNKRGDSIAPPHMPKTHVRISSSFRVIVSTTAARARPPITRISRANLLESTALVHQNVYLRERAHCCFRNSPGLILDRDVNLDRDGLAADCVIRETGLQPTIATEIRYRNFRSVVRGK
jgi:hypothetical protein